MFIQYEILVQHEKDERGIINLNHISSIEIEQHGGGYGWAINLFYINKHESKCIFILNDKDLLSIVYDGIIKAIKGQKTIFDHEKVKGFIIPL